MHCVQKPVDDFQSSSGAYTIIQVPAASDNLVWLIQYAPGRCAAVDGPDAKNALEYAQARGLVLDTIINTHTHPDHIGINRDLKKRGLLQQMRVIGPASRRADVPGITEPVKDGDVVELGSSSGTALLTEGHIDGHTSFLFDDILFCGDALFTAGCGYLFDGPPESMHRTLQKLSALPKETKVCCAHEYTLDNLKFAWMLEPSNAKLKTRILKSIKTREAGECCVPSTIGEETETNPFMRTLSNELRESLSNHFQMDFQHETPRVVFKKTRALKDAGKHKNLKWPF